jgi:hypothetical protein
LEASDVSEERKHFRLRNNVDWFQQFQLNIYNQSSNTRSPYNLSGVEMKMLLVGESSAHPTLLLSTVNGLIQVPSSGDFGEFIIAVPAITMWTLTEGTYQGDCLLFKPGGAVALAFSCDVSIVAGETPPTP